MRVQLCMLVGAAFVAVASAANLPSFISPCSASDPNLNECIEKVIGIAGQNFVKGIPELGIKTLDPVDIGKVQVDNPALKVIFTDTIVTGLGDFRLNSYKVNLEKGRAVLDFTANVTLKAHYDMDGQILILPIRGNGDSKIKITNLNIIIKYDFKTVDGYWQVVRHKDNYKMDKAQFKFTNLFNGNKELADTTTKFLNENWSIIMQEIAPPAIDQVIQKCVDEVEKLFAIIPAAELMKA